MFVVRSATLIRTFTTVLLVTLLLAGGAYAASAPGYGIGEWPNEGPAGGETRPRRVTSTVPSETTEAQPRGLQIDYVLYDGAIKPIPALESPKDSSAAVPVPKPSPVPQYSSSVISTAPLTAGEKFQHWYRHSFLTPGAYGSPIFNGLWKELFDNDDNKKDTVGNYFADSMTRAARSFAFGATSRFFEDGLFPTLFRQDPRYHRSAKKGMGARIGYALTRVFVTQGDRCACHQVNASFLLGGAAATGIANLWERSERTGPFHNIKRYYTHIYLTALSNVLKEFLGGQ